MSIKQLLPILCLFFSVTTHAVVTGEMIMVRSAEAFPETMATLQAAIRSKGYTLSRIQRVDVGLNAKGYKTDKYRVVFFGKGEQIQQLANQYPQLIPYLPLKIAIYAEGENTILTSANPAVFLDMFKTPALKPIFELWLKDITAILNTVQNSN